MFPITVILALGSVEVAFTFAAVCFVGMITWQLIDVFKYGYNKYKDGNGIELLPM